MQWKKQEWKFFFRNLLSKVPSLLLYNFWDTSLSLFFFKKISWTYTFQTVPDTVVSSNLHNNNFMGMERVFLNFYLQYPLQFRTNGTERTVENNGANGSKEDHKSFHTSQTTGWLSHGMVDWNGQQSQTIRQSLHHFGDGTLSQPCTSTQSSPAKHVSQVPM